MTTTKGNAMGMLSNIWSFFKTKYRLIIEYVLIGAVTILAGVTFTLWLKKVEIERNLVETKYELANVQQRMSIVEFVNDVHENRIGELKELRVKDAEALSGLMNDYRQLAVKDENVRRRLDSLETSNEIIRDYLNTPIPDDIKCLLDDSCSDSN